MKKSIGPRTMAFPTPVWVVGTYDANGKPNAMTAAWASICCSKPPAIGVSLRKATYSYGNIVARQAFTISIPSEAHVREADYLGMATGKEVNKFAATRLTPVASDPGGRPFCRGIPPDPGVQADPHPGNRPPHPVHRGDPGRQGR